MTKPRLGIVRRVRRMSRRKNARRVKEIIQSVKRALLLKSRATLSKIKSKQNIKQNRPTMADEDAWN